MAETLSSSSTCQNPSKFPKHKDQPKKVADFVSKAMLDKMTAPNWMNKPTPYAVYLGASGEQYYTDHHPPSGRAIFEDKKGFEKIIDGFKFTPEWKMMFHEPLKLHPGQTWEASLLQTVTSYYLTFRFDGWDSWNVARYKEVV